MVAGSSVEAPGPETWSVTASSTPTENPPSRRPVTFAAPRILVAAGDPSSPYTSPSSGERPIRRE